MEQGMLFKNVVVSLCNPIDHLLNECCSNITYGCCQGGL